MKTPEDEAFEQIERIQRTRTRWVPVEKPQSTWVRLTDKEIEECWDGDLSPYQMQCIREIESRLREKNNA
jgi:hypothetical protein